MALYSEAFEEDRFDDLVSALVTGALLERLLWMTILFAGYDTKKHKTQIPLERLIERARTFLVIGKENARTARVHRHSQRLYTRDRLSGR